MTDRFHILPVNDTKSHIESEACKCQPEVQENGRLLVHNSFDGREFIEPENSFAEHYDSTFVIRSTKPSNARIKWARRAATITEPSE